MRAMATSFARPSATLCARFCAHIFRILDCELDRLRIMVQFIACRLEKGAKVHVMQVGTTVSLCGKAIRCNEVRIEVKGRVKREQLCKKCCGAATRKFLLGVNLDIVGD